MKVLLINGSPHEKGCTYTALNEVAKALAARGIGSDIFGSAQSRSQAASPAVNVWDRANVCLKTK